MQAYRMQSLLKEFSWNALSPLRLVFHVPQQSLESVRLNRTVSRVHEVQVVTHQSAPVGHNEEADLGPALDSSYMPIAQSLRPYLSRPIREL